VPTSRTHYVSQFGDDATAQRGKSYRPYRTIAAALAAYTPGDLIHVLPGLHRLTEPIHRDGYLVPVTLTRANGVVTVTVEEPHGCSAGHRLCAGYTNGFDGELVVHEVLSPTAFTCLQAGPDATDNSQQGILSELLAIHCEHGVELRQDGDWAVFEEYDVPGYISVTGHADIHAAGAGPAVNGTGLLYRIQCANIRKLSAATLGPAVSGANVHLEVQHEIMSINYDAIMSLGGTNHIRARSIVGKDNAIELGNAMVPESTFIEADELVGGQAAVRIPGGTFAAAGSRAYIRAKRIIGASAFVMGSATTRDYELFLDADEMIGRDAPAVVWAANAPHVAVRLNCRRITSQFADPSGYAIALNGTNRLQLHGSPALLTTPAPAYSVYASSATDLVSFGTLRVAKPVHGNVTVRVGAVTIDATHVV